MGRTMFAVAVIFAGLSVAWFVLGGSVVHRTESSDRRIYGQVAGLWGAPQTQISPELVFRWRTTRVEREEVQDPLTGEVRHVKRERTDWNERTVILDRSSIGVDLSLEHRRKGLLWYSTYGVAFDGQFAYRHDDERDGSLVVRYRFPTMQASYDDFSLKIDGEEDSKVVPTTADGTRVVERVLPVRSGQEVAFEIAYRTRGLDHWRYAFGPEVSRVKNFTLTARTDFDDVDFSDGSLSPSRKADAPGGGQELVWRFENLISGFSIGVEMPRRLNPGPLAAQISFFAPVSLGFFFVWMFVITLMRGIRLHPMNYLFLGAAFFAFHLLFAYTVDHVDARVAFALASAVSVGLVVSYMRLVVGARFAALEAGVSQLVYLVLFSLAHFLEGLTGLTVTVGSILTLFALMQLTGRVDWNEKLSVLAVRPAAARAATGPPASA